MDSFNEPNNNNWAVDWSLNVSVLAQASSPVSDSQAYVTGSTSYHIHMPRVYIESMAEREGIVRIGSATPPSTSGIERTTPCSSIAGRTAARSSYKRWRPPRRPARPSRRLPGALPSPHPRRPPAGAHRSPSAAQLTFQRSAPSRSWPLGSHIACVQHPT